MAIISRFRAVAMVGKMRLTGVIAWFMWLAVHLVYITGFKNRVTALLHWFVSFIGRGRSERTTTEQQIFARAALNRLERGAADLVTPPGAFDAARAMIEADEEGGGRARQRRALPGRAEEGGGGRTSRGRPLLLPDPLVERSLVRR